MIAQLSWMSNTDLVITLAIIATMFIVVIGLIGAIDRWPAVMAVILGVAFIWFIGIPIIIFFVLAFASLKGKN